uniref:RING-type domain-containing protein n=1 Tax=Macrostomum lignano TaxID=282301 RepID=A0A1I8FH51_9PLAT
VLGVAFSTTAAAAPAVVAHLDGAETATSAVRLRPPPRGGGRGTLSRKRLSGARVLPANLTPRRLPLSLAAANAAAVSWQQRIGGRRSRSDLLSTGGGAGGPQRDHQAVVAADPAAGRAATFRRAAASAVVVASLPGPAGTTAPQVPPLAFSSSTLRLQLPEVPPAWRVCTPVSRAWMTASAAADACRPDSRVAAFARCLPWRPGHEGRRVGACFESGRDDTRTALQKLHPATASAAVTPSPRVAVESLERCRFCLEVHLPFGLCSIARLARYSSNSRAANWGSIVRLCRAAGSCQAPAGVLGCCLIGSKKVLEDPTSPCWCPLPLGMRVVELSGSRTRMITDSGGSALSLGVSVQPLVAEAAPFRLVWAASRILVRDLQKWWLTVSPDGRQPVLLRHTAAKSLERAIGPRLLESLDRNASPHGVGDPLPRTVSLPPPQPGPPTWVPSCSPCHCTETCSELRMTLLFGNEEFCPSSSSSFFMSFARSTLSACLFEASGTCKLQSFRASFEILRAEFRVSKLGEPLHHSNKSRQFNRTKRQDAWTKQLAGRVYRPQNIRSSCRLVTEGRFGTWRSRSPRTGTLIGGYAQHRGPHTTSSDQACRKVPRKRAADKHDVVKGGDGEQAHGQLVLTTGLAQLVLSLPGPSAATAGAAKPAWPGLAASMIGNEEGQQDDDGQGVKDVGEGPSASLAGWDSPPFHCRCGGAAGEKDDAIT